jgi:hypothetical protein
MGHGIGSQRMKQQSSFKAEIVFSLGNIGNISGALKTF